jgi:hypothetical protein
MQGTEWSGSKEVLDEIANADEDTNIVMNDAKDLVEVRHTLRQIVNVKGGRRAWPPEGGDPHPPTRREVNSCGCLQVGVQQENNSRVCT